MVQRRFRTRGSRLLWAATPMAVLIGVVSMAQAPAFGAVVQSVGGAKATVETTPVLSAGDAAMWTIILAPGP